MNIITNPSRTEWEALTARPSFDDADIEERVRRIIARVRKDGDEAIKQLSREIEKKEIDTLEVSQEEYNRAEAAVTPAVAAAVQDAIYNIESFHRAQRYSGIEVETVQGVTCWQKSVPNDTVGLYIPGGTAPLFSTVLMLGLPARIAGCREVIMCTPTGANGEVAPEVLYAARKGGVNHVYKVGGAQAIAAMAYGTCTIPRVDKIFGPGNRYVAKAKQQVSMDRVAIDMMAGPSEVMVIADEKANAGYVAADLLSQAEHGPDSQVFLVCLSQDFAARVAAEVDRQVALLPRCDIARKSLQESRLVVLDNEEECIALANYYAPEHLIISTENPWQIARRITAAGSIFLGEYSPESAGDYASGTYVKTSADLAMEEEQANRKTESNNSDGMNGHPQKP